MDGHALLARFPRYRNHALTSAALAVAVLSALPVGGTTSNVLWPLLLAVASWIPLLARTRWSLFVVAAVIALDAARVGVAAAATPATSIVPAATMLALFTVAELRSARLAWWVAAVAVVVQLTVADAISFDLKANVLYANWALVSTVIGLLVRERRERIAVAEQRAASAEATKVAEARRQVTAERIRIAHEIHDVLAHHITVVNAQAGVAQYLLRTDPEAAELALAGIGDNTKAALDELRATLGLLRSERDDVSSPRDRQSPDLSPVPGADRLPQLVAGFASAGTSVELVTSGTPGDLPTASDLSVYRITQEALTNATKHAPGSAVRVLLDWSVDMVTLTVTNSAARRPPPLPANCGTGNGLIGMRERAASAGGTVIAEATTDGGYRVLAWLPTLSPAAEPLSTDPMEHRP